MHLSLPHLQTAEDNVRSGTPEVSGCGNVSAVGWLCVTPPGTSAGSGTIKCAYPTPPTVQGQFTPRVTNSLHAASETPIKVPLRPSLCDQTDISHVEGHLLGRVLSATFHCGAIPTGSEQKSGFRLADLGMSGPQSTVFPNSFGDHGIPTPLQPSSCRWVDQYSSKSIISAVSICPQASSSLGRTVTKAGRSLNGVTSLMDTSLSPSILGDLDIRVLFLHRITAYQT